MFWPVATALESMNAHATPRTPTVADSVPAVMEDGYAVPSEQARSGVGIGGFGLQPREASVRLRHIATMVPVLGPIAQLDLDGVSWRAARSTSNHVHTSGLGHFSLEYGRERGRNKEPRMSWHHRMPLRIMSPVTLMSSCHLTPRNLLVGGDGTFSLPYQWPSSRPPHGSVSWPGRQQVLSNPTPGGRQRWAPELGQAGGGTEPGIVSGEWGDLSRSGKPWGFM